MFGSQYGWSAKDTLDLPLIDIGVIQDAMIARVKEQNKQGEAASRGRSAGGAGHGGARKSVDQAWGKLRNMGVTEGK